MLTKEEVNLESKLELDVKIKCYHKVLSDLMEGPLNDAKSSAGDTHDTSRSMMQIEQEKTGKQMKELEEMKVYLDKIKSNSNNDKIQIGSLIKTNIGYFYIAVALGKLKVGKEEVYVISPISPLGSKLLGLSLNNSIEINNKKVIIEFIY